MARSEAIFESIARLERPCLLLSPHLDDAILSAGALISWLAGRTQVTVATVFTSASADSPGRLARRLIHEARQPDGQSLFAQRRREDLAVCQGMGVSTVHLGFVDAAWRRRKPLHPLLAALARVAPEVAQLYPSSSVVWGRVAKSDALLRADVEEWLRSWRARAPLTVFFCPAAIGGHVDHELTRQACQHVAPASILWADFPYLARSRTHRVARLRDDVYRRVEFGHGIDRKLRLVRGYVSQVSSLFGAAPAPEIAEVYYVPRSTASAAASSLLPELQQDPIAIEQDHPSAAVPDFRS